MGITFVDCALLAGGYHNGWDFPVGLTDEYLAAMAALSSDRVELGFRSLRRSGFRGAAAYPLDGFNDLLDLPEGMVLGVMVNAAEPYGRPRSSVWRPRRSSRRRRGSGSSRASP